jgi:hypothetical protein
LIFNNLFGEVKNPNPQEKCITNRTIGNKSFSFNFFPIIKPPAIIKLKYNTNGRINMGSMIESAIDIRLAKTVKGGARYRKFTVARCCLDTALRHLPY